MKNKFPQKKVFIMTMMLITLPIFLFANSINYLSEDFNSISEKGKNQNKYFFVKFSAKWCATCKVMDSSANNNSTLVNFVEENFIPVKADVDTPIGKDWLERFDVRSLPTLIVFSSEGYEVARKLDGFSSTKFLNFLENSLGKKATIAFNNPIAKPTIVATSYRPINIPPTPILVKHHVVEDQSNNQKWTLLIGKYATLKKANTQIKQLKNKLSDDAILLTAKSENNKIIYHVTIGNIGNEQEAIVLRKKLLSKNIRCTLLKG